VREFFAFLAIVLVIIMLVAFPVGGIPLALMAGLRFCHYMSRR